MKHNRRRSTHASRRSPSVLERIQVDVAGIDCGAAEHYVSVPPDRDPTPVQSFRTFTADLERLADWLVACRVTSVAMEATGVYWIPVYDILEARGLEVLLVNARHVKHVPGRKSDVEDCEWLRELHSVGLLRGSFRPAGPILALRALVRHRDVLVHTAGDYVCRMQKTLVEMNLQLPLVVSDMVLPPSTVAQAARSSSPTGAVGHRAGTAHLTAPMRTNINKDGDGHTNTSRNVSRRVASPACIAGVRTSRPNFRAPCGRTKL